jgi:glycerol-3-phosphate cytidylyltransferase-like family protein
MYLPAQNYYDSCLSFLDAQYPGYQELSNKARNLTDLANNLITIMREDSLQRIAQMPDRDRYKIIDKIIADIVAEEERQKQEEQLQQANSLIYMQNQQNQQTTQTAGKWYFYNPSSISYGMGEFRRKWGNRKLEDNWRRKNKMVIITMSEEDELAAIDSAKNPIMNKKSREYYLQDLPLTDSLMEVSNKNIEEALFNAGEI